MKIEIVSQILKYVNKDGTVDVKGLLWWLESNKVKKKEDREIKFDDGDISHAVVYEGEGWKVDIHYVVGKDGTMKLVSLDIS